MRIGILTHQLYTNYGGILQNFALQKVLVRMGYDVKTIDYKKKSSVGIKLLSFVKRLYLRIFKKSSLPLRGWTNNKENKIISQHTRNFVKENIRVTKSIPLSQIGRLKNDFDALVVGSDQVWRYLYLGSHIDKFYFSSFPNVPIKIAYAASFGTDTWETPVEITDNCKKLVREFKGVSVREESGIKLCRDYLNIDAVQVLDPTMLLTADDYISLVEKSKISSHEGNLMTYILDKTKEKKHIIDLVSRELSLTPIEILPNKTFSEVGKKGLTQCIVPPVEKWIRGFIDAEMVITDSFHGTVFALIFNKPFWVLENKRRGNARMESLLQMFKLEHRLIDIECIENVDFGKAIDWNQVNNIREGLIDKSMMFLHENL